MSNNSFKPNPLRGIACVPALRLHAVAATARVGLTQALDRARRRVRSTNVKPDWRAAFSRLPQAFDHRHKLRAGKSASTPFLGSAFQSEIIGRAWPSGAHG